LKVSAKKTVANDYVYNIMVMLKKTLFSVSSNFQLFTLTWRFSTVNEMTGEQNFIKKKC